MRTIAIVGMLFLPLLAQAEKTDLEMTGQQGVHVFMAVSKPWAEDQAFIERTVRGICSGKRICISHIWDKKSGAPKAFPLTDKQVKDELATFQMNKNTGREELLWNCKIFQKAPKNSCF